MHTHDFGKMKLPVTAEDYIKSMPHISDTGGVTLGSKKTTVFVVDAMTGRLIYSYGSSDSPTALQGYEGKSVLSKKDVEEWAQSSSISVKKAELPLYITRTDYLLQSFPPNSDKILWNVTFSEIGAAYICQDFNSLSGDVPLNSNYNSGYELSSEKESQFKMPLSCQSKAVVYRIRDSSMLEYFSIPDKLPEAHHKGKMLQVSGPSDMSTSMLPSPSRPNKFLDFYRRNDGRVVLQMPSPEKYSYVYYLAYYLDQALGAPHLPLFLFSIVVIIVGFAIYCFGVVVSRQVSSYKQPRNLNAHTVSSKKKKNRKPGNGKNTGNVPTNNKHMFYDLKGEDFAHMEGRKIGKLFISNAEIAKGSNGTVVLEGLYEGRPVAVKRLVQVHHDVAFKEIENLIASDRHPNIVRWYGVEHDQDFVYLSLERCDCSLHDLIQIYSDASGDPGFSGGQESRAMIEYRVRLDSVKTIIRDIELWKSNGYPSPLLIKLMRDVVSGLVHLHELGIIHRDLKPQNVLIVKERSLYAKLSDMGISKRLLGDMSSLGHHATGYGSSGWQAPEQLRQGRQTRALDLFSLGCVLFYCITGGKHPFGDHLERDVNIVKNQVDLFLVEHIPEAVHLLSQLLDPNPESRPKASEVLQHPLFWNSEMRLAFLRDTSDRVELEDRETESYLYKELEGVASTALGAKWDEKMEPAFISNIGRYRRYKYDSVRDLLRVMRNKLSHYRELPKEIQEILGPVPDGFDGYFASRFPRLLIEVYKVMYKYCREEESFKKYFRSNLV